MESSRPLSPTISRDVQNQPSPIREKLIYQTLPKNPNILDCLDITDQGLHFPYYRFGNIRTYLRDNQVSQHIRHKWIKNAIDAVAFIHSHGVVHADISPRNFLVADDLSIKLCDFAGSIIGDMEAFVEEDRYYLAPWSPRTFTTDLFALGCLIYELSSGARPI
jgi:serine/threonine protein kinase